MRVYSYRTEYNNDPHSTTDAIKSADFYLFTTISKEYFSTPAKNTDLFMEKK